MKITLVADVYGKENNGTSITAHRLVENLKKRGNEVKVISASPDSDIVLPKRDFWIFNNYVEKNGVTLASIDEDKLREGIAGSDVVHLLLPFKVSRRAKKIAQELHIPYTTAYHCQPENVSSHFGLKNFKLFNKWLYKRFLKIFYHDVEFIHCPSQFIADQITANGYKARKYVISNGVISKIKPIKIKKPDEYKDKICILCVGRFAREKRQDVLIKAIKLSKYADRIQLLMAGNGPLEHKYKKMSRGLKNKPRMEFFEFPELLEAFNYSDLYVHASDIEIEGISCIEAISCGQIPIIADSPRSATRHFALTENNLFKVNNSKSLAQRIDYWIEHPEEKEELSKRYIEYSKQFAIEKCVDEMEKMFKDAVEYYTEYYKTLPTIPIKPHIDYPTSFDQHILECKHNKNHTLIDKNYKYIRKNPFYNLGAGILRVLALLLLPFWTKPYTHYKIKGKENIKGLKKKGVIIVSNHVHSTDSPIIATRIFGWGRKVRIVTLSENIDIPIAGDLIKALGVLPLGDTLGGMKKFKQTIDKLLAQNKPVLFFPEAALWPYYRGIRPFHKGAFVFAVNDDVPILPIISTFITRKNGKQKMIVNILPPIYPEGKTFTELQEYTQKYCEDFANNFYKKYR